MKLIQGNIWDSGATNIAVTTNSVIRSDGSLVMGAGIAKQAIMRHPELSYLAGAAVKKRYGQMGMYGFLGPFSFEYEGQPENIYLFQTKINFTHPSRLSLIEFSVSSLNLYLNQNPGFELAMNFPGIGKGELRMPDVLPIIQRLPDSVSVYWM